MSGPAPGLVVARLRQAVATPAPGRARRTLASLTASLTARRYLLGTVLAWVLVVYLAAGPTLHGPASSAGSGGSRPATAAGPLALSPLSGAPASEGVAPFPAVPAFGDLGPFSFTPPAPPPANPQLSCPLPIPQSQTTPFSAGIFLSFESPFLELSGPFAAYDIPTLGAIAPLVPLLSPLVSISEPVMNEVTPNLSVLANDVVVLEQAAGLDSPQEQQYAQQFEPYWLQLVTSLTPVEQALVSTTGGQCLELFENELAVLAAQQDLQLPPLPVLPSGLPPTGSGSAAVEQAAAADTKAPVAQVVLPWADGVPPSAVAAVTAMAARGTPALVELEDSPPAGLSSTPTSFSDFVATAVHALPGATAFQVDAPGPDPSAPAAMATLVHGLAAADYVRRPGQLLGLGVPATVSGPGGPVFWRAFDAAMEGYQPNMVDFVAADLTPQAEPTTAAAVAEAVTTARTLEAQWATLGGVPADAALFGAVELVGTPLDVAAVQSQLATYQGALAGLHVRALAPVPAG